MVIDAYATPAQYNEYWAARGRSPLADEEAAVRLTQAADLIDARFATRWVGDQVLEHRAWPRKNTPYSEIPYVLQVANCVIAGDLLSYSDTNWRAVVVGGLRLEHREKEEEASAWQRITLLFKAAGLLAEPEWLVTLA